MAGAIDFYFDFSSPYGYFAATRIEELAVANGRLVNWHPVLLGVLFRTVGTGPLTSFPLKGEYSFHDFERTARFHGIPYHRPPQFPLATQAAARAMLWTAETVGEARAIELAQAIYRAMFVDGVRIDHAEEVARIGAAIGLDAEALAAGQDSEPARDRLRAETQEALERGVFGSPFMIVDGEPFWGFDRFVQLDAFLKGAL
jgi:2-hydroxychromene-2-carboxylate isomerase